MQEVARGQPNGLAAFDNGADDVGEPGRHNGLPCARGPLGWRFRVLPQSSVGGRRVTCSCARVSPDFERRSSFVDAGWAEFWHRTGSEAMSAIRVPRTRRENTVQQRDATLPGGDLDPGLYLRLHAGIRHLWRSPTQASQLTLAFKRGVATLGSGSTGTGRDGDARRSVRSIPRIISRDSP